MSERIKGGIPPDQAVVTVVPPQELPAAPSDTSFGRFYDGLWNQLLKLYSQQSGKTIEELTQIYQERRKQLHQKMEAAVASPLAVASVEGGGRKGYPGGYYGINDLLTAASNLFPRIWLLTPYINVSWTQERSLSTNIAILDRLRRKSYGLETDIGKYITTLTLMHQARTLAASPLRGRKEMLTDPHISVSLTSLDVPKEQIPKLLDRTYPPKYLATQLQKAIVPMEQKLFGKDKMTPQLWQALVYLDMKIGNKGEILEALLTGRKNRNYSTVLEMIIRYRHSIPDFAKEELSLVLRGIENRKIEVNRD